MLERLWHVVLAIILLGGMISLQRYRFTGWQPLYSLHLFLMLAFTACWLLRNRYSFDTRVIILLILFYSVGIGGLFSFGVITGGIWWLILSLLIANVFYSRTTSIIHAAI